MAGTEVCPTQKASSDTAVRLLVFQEDRLRDVQAEANTSNWLPVEIVAIESVDWLS